MEDIAVDRSASGIMAKLWQCAEERVVLVLATLGKFVDEKDVVRSHFVDVAL